MIVLETSARIELLTDDWGLRKPVAGRLLEEVAAGDPPYAPALIDAEAAKVLRRLARHGFAENLATRAIDELAGMAVVRLPKTSGRPSSRPIRSSSRRRRTG